MIALRPAKEAREELEERAAEFLQRRRYWDWSDADQSELDAWLAESVLNRVAYLRLEAGAERMARAVSLHPSKPILPRERIRRARFVLPLLAAASIASIAAVGIPYVRALIEPPVRTFATDVGGRALFKFGDGTELELNTNTALRYRMTTDQRIVWLDKGEAYFHVAHDSSNPFTVIAAGHRITDLGTEFLVREERGALDVTLVKGRAQLRSENPGAGAAVLVPGDEAVATPVSMVVTKKTGQEIADELAWRGGMVVFHNTRLADAAREFNRYNRTKLIIADPAVADYKIGGGFKVDDTNNFLRLAQAVLKLRIEREGNDILISRADEPKRAVHMRGRAGAP